MLDVGTSANAIIYVVIRFLLHYFYLQESRCFFLPLIFSKHLYFDIFLTEKIINSILYFKNTYIAEKLFTFHFLINERFLLISII